MSAASDSSGALSQRDRRKLQIELRRRELHQRRLLEALQHFEDMAAAADDDSNHGESDDGSADLFQWSASARGASWDDVRGLPLLA